MPHGCSRNHPPASLSVQLHHQYPWWEVPGVGLTAITATRAKVIRAQDDASYLFNSNNLWGARWILSSSREVASLFQVPHNRQPWWPYIWSRSLWKIASRFLHAGSFITRLRNLRPNSRSLLKTDARRSYALLVFFFLHCTAAFLPRTSVHSDWKPEFLLPLIHPMFMDMPASSKQALFRIKTKLWPSCWEASQRYEN